MSSLRHHSSAPDESLSSRHDVTLPPPVLAGLAPRIVSARHVRESPLTQLYEASAPTGHRFGLHVISPQLTDLAGDAHSLAAALGELPTLPGLTIPAIEWITEVDGMVCYATAWHEGAPVSALDPVRSPSPSALAAASRELCGELHALHRRGLAHGMIVPDTLTFASDERRFILEAAGVMTALGLCGVTPATVRATCGTSSSAAPELASATSAVSVDMRADMFSLGGALYELLTGCPPFGGRTTATVMATVLLDARTSESASPVALAVTDVILRCLEKDPADRWPDFDALGNALAAAVRGEHPVQPRPLPAQRSSQLARAAALLKAALLGGARPR